MSEVPRWLELEAEIGFCLERLRQIQRESAGSALERAIDNATGRTDAWLAEATEIAGQIDAARAELMKLGWA